MSSPIQVLILCAGYGTRLQRGIRDDPTQAYSHLLGVPKPLLPVGGVPLISRWVAQCEDAGIGRDNIHLVVNHYYYDKFMQWARDSDFPLGNILDDGTSTNEDRLGAVRDIHLLIHTRELQQHPWIIVGGDTLFFDDFSLTNVVKEYEADRSRSIVLYYNVEATEKTGILETDAQGLVTAFLEKPARTDTESRKACPCFYILSEGAVRYLQVYVDQATTLKEVDAPGSFIGKLHAHEPVFAYYISGRFDLGALDTYITADEYFSRE